MTREQVARKHIMYRRLHRAATISAIDVSDIEDSGTVTVMAFLSAHSVSEHLDLTIKRVQHSMQILN